MNFEEIRLELQRLNSLRYQIVFSDKMRKGIQLQESPKLAIKLMHSFNPDQLTWENLHREVAALEERIVRETGFGVEHWLHPELGEEMGSYVLYPKNQGWLDAKRCE